MLTDEQKRGLTGHLIQTGSLSLACRLAGVDEATVHMLRATDPVLDEVCRQYNTDPVPAAKSALRWAKNQIKNQKRGK